MKKSNNRHQPAVAVKTRVNAHGKEFEGTSKGQEKTVAVKNRVSAKCGEYIDRNAVIDKDRDGS